MGGAVPSVQRLTGSPNIRFYLEAASINANSFYADDLVKWNATGGIEIATAGAILGIATRNALGDDSELGVDVLTGAEELTAIYGSSATASSLVGDVADFTFTVSATAGHTIDEDSATTDCVIVGRDTRDAWTTVGGRLVIKIFPTALQSQPSS